jgi:hypothetical protein
MMTDPMLIFVPREFLNEADDPVRVYTSTTAEGLSLSHGNWILLGLLVGSNGGGHGVCLSCP